MTKESETIDVEALEEDARSSEYRESYRVLERFGSYRIGVGARLSSSGQATFFVEVVVSFCHDSTGIDLMLLEKNLMFLKELQALGYSLSCQEDNNVSCEMVASSNSLASDYRMVRSTAEKISLGAPSGAGS